MIKSMTGYGKAEVKMAGGRLTVEFKSVNGKDMAFNIKTTLIPKDRELELRKRVADSLVRGSVEMFVRWEPDGDKEAGTINKDVALNYCKQIMDLCSAAGISPDGGVLASVLRMPDVLEAGSQEAIDEGNWPEVSAAVDKALEAVNRYRETEGEALYRDVTSRVGTILEIENEVESYEKERLDAVKERILRNAREAGVNLDPERFEQEMVYYLEKLDINEEKVRLRHHCKYFLDTIDGDPCPGKKLGFIIQEMGREINTTGSKASHAGIQKCVVRMKDELEKIREQSMNIL